MNGYLLDTNVLSELRKRTRADAKVLAWFAGAATDELFVSVLALGEIRRGIEQARLKDPAQAMALERWLHGLQHLYSDRILPIGDKIADRWGRLSLSHPLSTVDGLKAATALVHDLTLVTRNISDVSRTGATVLNPFAS